MADKSIAEELTLNMMAAYTTNPRLFLETVETLQPAVVDGAQPRTINETRRAQALIRSFDRRPPRLSMIGGSGTYDMSIGTNIGIGGNTRNSGIVFSGIGRTSNGMFGDRNFPGGHQNAKYQGIGYRLGQHLDVRPYPSTITSQPTSDARSALYRRKSAGAIRPEFPNSWSRNTRTLINKAGNFQPFIEGRFGPSISRERVIGTAQGGLRRLAAADPPTIRDLGSIPARTYMPASTTKTITPRVTTVPGSGALSTALADVAEDTTQEYIRGNTPKKVAQREKLRIEAINKGNKTFVWRGKRYPVNK